MQTITKKVAILIHVLPLRNPDDEPIFGVVEAKHAGDWGSEYERFRAEVEVPVPVKEYTNLGTVQATAVSTEGEEE